MRLISVVLLSFWFVNAYMFGSSINDSLFFSLLGVDRRAFFCFVFLRVLEADLQRYEWSWWCLDVFFFEVVLDFLFWVMAGVNLLAVEII